MSAMSVRKPAPRKTPLAPVGAPKRAAASAAAAKTRELALAHGRQLALVRTGADDLVEVRGADGALELRIRMTADGPVLQMESLRLSLKAAGNVDVQCQQFSVQASEALALRSEGALKISGRDDVQVDASGDVRVTGTLIHLN
jgi:hypothetical protein